MNIYRETNLKIKQALVETSTILTPELANQMKGNKYKQNIIHYF